MPKKPFFAFFLKSTVLNKNEKQMKTTYFIKINGAEIAVNEDGQIFQNGKELKQYKKRSNVCG